MFNLKEKKVKDVVIKDKKAFSIKLPNNRTIIGVICIVLALILCFVVAPLFTKAQTGQSNTVVASEQILKGDMITKSNITVKKIGSYNLPENTYKDTELVIGQYAATDIPDGDLILTNKVAESPGNNDYLIELKANKVAASFTINSFASGLSGKLMAGDVIQISSVGSDGIAILTPELRYVKVLAATAETGNDVDETVVGEDGRVITYGTITVEVSQSQLSKLIAFEDASKTHVALVFRGSSEKVEAYLDSQDTALGGK